MVLGAAVLLICGGNPAKAGSPLGELEHRYKCRIGDRVLEVTYDFEDQPETVGIRPRGRDLPVLTVNERRSFERPYEVVAFEYFSACEQARKLFETSLRKPNGPERLLEDPDWTRAVVFGSDCEAIAQMRREGLLGGVRGFQRILDDFSYERARMNYLHVLFHERADNLRNRCPF
jgi:hypothetical protein